VGEPQRPARQLHRELDASDQLDFLFCRLGRLVEATVLYHTLARTANQLLAREAPKVFLEVSGTDFF
jgi:hypothetical protein